jgi:Protein of unknown function (DUF3455)
MCCPLPIEQEYATLGEDMLRIVCITVIFCSIAWPQAEQPSVEAPAGTTLLLTAAGEGSQIYTCTGGHWTLKAPEARLLDEHGHVIGYHFAGPTWRLTDGSEVKGKMIVSRPAQDPSSVPSLLLQAIPASGTGKFADVSYIERADTHGGAAGTDPCTSGEKRVPYTAKYSFYTGKP